MAHPAPHPRFSFFRSVGVVSAAVALSRATGLVREMVMARLFGAGVVNDAFQVAFRIPNLTRDLFAEGALSSAFVPTFTQYLTHRGKEEAARLNNAVTAGVLLVVGTVCGLGVVFSPELVSLIAPGFERVPGKFELAVLLTRIMFPFLLTVALAAQAMGVLNASERFGIPALASTLFNVGSVAIGVAAGATVGRRFQSGAIVSMACGVVAGGALQWLWQLPSLGRAGFQWRPRLELRHPGLRQIARLMGPAILGNAAVQINVTVNTNLASSLTDSAGHVLNGPVSWLGYAFRFMQLPLGVFGVAVASATLPAVSRSAAVERTDEFRVTLARSLGTVLLLTIPSAAGLAVLGRSMIGAIYEGGRFLPSDTAQTARALTCYSVGLAGYAAIKILAPAFYALGDARVPMVVSLASIAVNLGAALALIRWTGLGHAGLALATSLVALFGAAALFETMRRRIGGLEGRALVSSAVVHRLAGPAKHVHLLNAAVSIPLGVLVFGAAALTLGVPELEALRTACYTAVRNAPRPEVGDSPARGR